VGELLAEAQRHRNFPAAACEQFLPSGDQLQLGCGGRAGGTGRERGYQIALKRIVPICATTAGMHATQLGVKFRLDPSFQRLVRRN